VVLELRRLKCGLEFFLPVEEAGRITFFRPGEIAYFSSNKSGSIVEEEGYFTRSNESGWDLGFDEWTAIERSPDCSSSSFFRPNQLVEMVSLQGGFSIIDADWNLQGPQGNAFITRAYRSIDMGEMSKPR